MKGWTFSPAAELMMMIDPPPASTRCGAPAITVFQTPRTLMLIESSKIVGVTLSQALGTQIAAFAMTTSSRPSSVTAPSTTDFRPSRSCKSSCADTMRRSSFSTSRTVSSRSAGVGES